MKFSTINEWISWIASLNGAEIDLGLERVKGVGERLGVLAPLHPVIIVGGTNGKGSTVAGLESVYRAAGYHVGVFTSPILFKHNEQVRINGIQPSDEAFCLAFEKVEQARGDVALTPFEYHTLAALILLQSQLLDVAILEVGLGGRLDAVNVLDADVSVVTSISLDHTEWLGSTREEIGFEKAGIFRAGQRAVCGEVDVPASILKYATEIGAKLYCVGKEFWYEETPVNWGWGCRLSEHDHVNFYDLPISTLATQNMATVLMVITLLQLQLPVTREAIEKGLKEVKLPGRIQIIPGPVTKIFDVAHNAGSVALLAKRLSEIACFGKTYAVFSMLADKEIAECVRLIAPVIDEWLVAPLLIKRGASLDNLRAIFQEVGVKSAWFYPSVEEAYNLAIIKTQLSDRIVVFGSFHTVAEVLGKVTDGSSV